MEDLCLKEGGYYFDLYGEPYEDIDFYDFVHMTPTGTEQLGQLLSREFLSSGLIEHGR
jgi:hypothetical protein